VSPSVLDRVSSSFSQKEFTELQSQVDRLVSGFVEQATEGRSLAAMMAGGMAYRLGRIGVLSVGVQNFEPLRHAVSIGVGLGAEATAFEMTNRALMDLGTNGRSPFNQNLWRWDGPDGIRQGLLSSLVTFGSLKGLGTLAQGQGLVVQHLFQSSGMVLGHQISGALGITSKPEGTLAEQFLRAEITNLQMSGGIALGHSLTGGGIQAVERGLDLSLRATDVRMALRNRSEEGTREEVSLQMQPAFSAVGERGPTILHMSSENGGRGGGYRPAADLVSLARGAMKGQPEALETLGRFAENHFGALRALANAAERNLNALLFMIELSKGDHPVVRIKLKSLDMGHYEEQRNPGLGEMGEALLALSEMGNHGALDVLCRDIITYRDSPALALLESLAFRGHSGAILSIAEAAVFNPKAVGSLSRLSREGHPVKRILRDLPANHYVTLAVLMEYGEMVPVLAELSLFGNREAFEGLSRAAHLHENAVRILQVLAYHNYPRAIGALADVARSMNKGMANLALTSLRTLATWGFQEAAQALEAFPLSERGDPSPSKPAGWFRRFLKMAAHYLGQVNTWP
jgi:hypothetical protein